MGPTASGKSGIALRLAEELGTEIISVDSMQVYRHMNIGTAKPSPAEQARVPHHMIDLVEPEQRFSVAEFQQMGRAVLSSRSDGTTLVAGGSGLHFRALVDPMRFPPHDEQLRAEIQAMGPEAVRFSLLAADPDAGSVLDLHNPRRVERALEVLRLTGQTPTQRANHPEAAAVADYVPLFPLRAVGLDPGRRLSARVEARLGAMLDAGLLDEVSGLVGRLGPTAAEAVGYKQLLPVATGRMSMQEGVAAALRATMSLAKRQRTLFRRDPRITWVPWFEDPQERYEAVRTALGEVPG